MYRYVVCMSQKSPRVDGPIPQSTIALGTFSPVHYYIVQLEVQVLRCTGSSYTEILSALRALNHATQLRSL